MYTVTHKLLLWWITGFCRILSEMVCNSGGWVGNFTNKMLPVEFILWWVLGLKSVQSPVKNYFEFQEDPLRIIIKKYIKNKNIKKFNIKLLKFLIN